MSAFFYVTDLHGRTQCCDKLFSRVLDERPRALLIGGDLSANLGQQFADDQQEFIEDHFLPCLARIRQELGAESPDVAVILGNDDPCSAETILFDAEERGLLRYIHARATMMCGTRVFGYGYVPPTPFLKKDWERYDVSRYVPPGCVSPEEGFRSREISEGEVKWSTIESDLAKLVDGQPAEHSIFLFHAPPCDTPLDRAALDGRIYEHVPLDVHVGSIAIRRFIEHCQPLLTLHGHVHESTRLTGQWMTKIGRTVCINAAHDGPELSLVRFDPDDPGSASRELL